MRATMRDVVRDGHDRYGRHERCGAIVATVGRLLLCHLAVGMLLGPSVVAQSRSKARSPLATTINLSLIHTAALDWINDEPTLLSVNASARSKWTATIASFQLKASVVMKVGVHYREDSTDPGSIRVGDNEVTSEGMIVWPIGWRVDPYVSSNLRTQVTEGFKGNGEKRIRISNFWDPVTSQQAAGFTYSLAGNPSPLSTRLGLALQQIRAEKNRSTTDDPKTRGVSEGYKASSGIEFVAEAALGTDSTVRYNARLGVFGSFDDLDVWSARWENDLSFRIWRFIALTWSIEIVHDVKQSLRTQFHSSLTLGVVGEL